jgi:SAM-dependent methyltransferase
MSPFIRPSPVPQSHAPYVDPHLPVDEAAAWLAEGNQLRLTHPYGLGADILEALSRRLGKTQGLQGEALRDETRRRRELASGLLVPVEHGEVRIEGATRNRLLAALYGDLDRFWLPLIEVQSLHTSARRHHEGMPFPVLGHPLHPWHGVYAPKRTAHLELLATWLSGASIARRHAIDVGTGCGVLAFLLARAGFDQVTATDINPNAVHSVQLDVARHSPPPPIQAVEANLLEGGFPPADVIVFNPPWIPGRVHGPLDRALYFDDDLFERFFSQANATLAPGGRLVVVFSNMSRLLRPDLPHPIETELAGGRFVLDQRMQRKVKGRGGRRTKERVELWVLRHADVADEHGHSHGDQREKAILR